MIEIRILKALAYCAVRDEGNALAEMERALSLAAPEGFMRSFLDEGKEVAGLLVKLRGRKTVPREFLERLLAAFGEKTAPGVVYGPAVRLEEPLSQRELEVLRLLDTRLSSEEIAEELVVSVNTARSHIKSIYQKLSVHSRYQAVSRARELDLI